MVSCRSSMRPAQPQARRPTRGDLESKSSFFLLRWLAMRRKYTQQQGLIDLGRLRLLLKLRARSSSRVPRLVSDPFGTRRGPAHRPAFGIDRLNTRRPQSGLDFIRAEADTWGQGHLRGILRQAAGCPGCLEVGPSGVVCHVKAALFGPRNGLFVQCSLTRGVHALALVLR